MAPLIELLSTVVETYPPYGPDLLISLSLVTVTLLFLYASSYASAIVNFSDTSDVISFYCLNFFFHNSTSLYNEIICYSDYE